MKLKKLLLKTAISGFLLWFVGLYFVTPYFVSASPTASFVTSWGEKEDGYTISPLTMSVDSGSGNLNVIANQTDNQFHVFDAAGNLLDRKTLSSGGCTPLFIASGAGGKKYLSVPCSSTIFIYDSSNNVISYFGGYGTGNGQFQSLWNLRYSTFNNKLYVLDANTAHTTVQIFDADGNYLSQFGSYGTGDGQFQFPSSIGISPVDGTLYIGDSHRIQAFDANGNFLRKWGSNGTGDGQIGTGGNGNFITVSSDGTKVYFADTPNKRVEIFSDQGVFLSKFGTAGSGNGQFDTMTGIELSPDETKLYVPDTTYYRIQVFSTADNSYQSTIQYSYVPPAGHFGYSEGMSADVSGNIYLADSVNNRIQEFDSSGNFIKQFGTAGTGNGQMKYPLAVAVSPLNGNVYVVDSGHYSAARIEIFDASGNYISSFGSQGSADGQFDYPEDVTIDTDGNVYLVDSNNNRIDVFDKDGNFLRTWNTYGGGGTLSYPTAITYSPVNQHVYVYDSGSYRVHIYDTSGNYISSFGSSGTGNGQFDYAEDISVDAGGNVYVLDSGNSRVEVFDANGNFITTWGSAGTTGNMEFNYPTALANFNDYIYVFDDIGAIKKYTLDLTALPPVITTADSVQKPFTSVSGTSEAGASIGITENGNTICAATADGSGNWTCTLYTPITSTGAHTISAVQTDTSGNVSTAATKTITVTAPANRSGSVPTGGGSSSGFNPNKTNTNTTPVTTIPITPVVPVVPANGGVSCSLPFAQKLHFGSYGDDVKKVQQFLKDKGYFFGRITGFYGFWTEASVKDFQQAHSKEILVPLKLVKPTGNWSYATIGLANNLLCKQ